MSKGENSFQSLFYEFQEAVDVELQDRDSKVIVVVRSDSSNDAMPPVFRALSVLLERASGDAKGSSSTRSKTNKVHPFASLDDELEIYLEAFLDEDVTLSGSTGTNSSSSSSNSGSGITCSRGQIQVRLSKSYSIEVRRAMASLGIAAPDCGASGDRLALLVPLEDVFVYTGRKNRCLGLSHIKTFLVACYHSLFISHFLFGQVLGDKGQSGRCGAHLAHLDDLDLLKTLQRPGASLR